MARPARHLPLAKLDSASKSVSVTRSTARQSSERDWRRQRQNSLTFMMPLAVEGPTEDLDVKVNGIADEIAFGPVG